MAISRMRLVTVSGDLSKLDKAIEACCKNGDFHIEPASEFFDSRQGYSALNENNPYSHYLTKLENALSDAKLTVSENDTVSSDLESSELAKFVDSFEADTKDLSSRLNTLTTLCDKARTNLEQLQHFTSLDVDLYELFSLRAL